MAFLLLSLCFYSGLQVAAFPANPRDLHGPHRRENATLDSSYSLPFDSSDAIERKNSILEKRRIFLYGPSILGNVSYWPGGTLGNLTTTADLAAFKADAEFIEVAVEEDETVVTQNITTLGTIRSLSDYEALYKGQWKESMPAGLDRGILSNYTEDSMFSMERLSVNPYSIKRLNPSLDALPFLVEDTITSNITTTTLQSLFDSGNIFYVDHRYQGSLQKTARYAAACDAYFYIHPKSGDFLPLAIRTNAGTDLIYTPADTMNDWLLAKMMFNLNDFWHSQWYHLSGTHNVIEIVYEAAYRTLSNDHPIMALLIRLTPELFAYRQIAIATLVGPGGYVDQLFAFSGEAAAQTTTSLYNSGVSGAFQANYFHEDLANRGLINNTFGDKIKHFPFFEDASVIHAAIKDFMMAFVDSYYFDSSTFMQDDELQAWILESVPAKILDFPRSVDRQTLIDILTHIAYLGSAAHQTLNTNDISEASGSLPFHPFSFYQPIPTAKGIVDIIPFLPNVTQSIGQIGLTTHFARPEYVSSNRSLSHMFDDTEMLVRMNSKTAEAANLFQGKMRAFSNLVSTREFDAHGLSQGMPFIWKALDPETAPYYLTV